jgi:hypothetical protein
MSGEEIRSRIKPQDKSGGLGYNRDLIGAAQDSSLRFGAGKSIPTAESNRATRGCGSGGPSRVMATGIKEVRSNV